ncbi:hypothetical protein QYE76_051684 [Lolium multiflorum]|uniref:Uncharacterized protein n=1 Tax=Lolium multiflorum TaxID=4521 RepID=A0AAD8STT0_LOLMU|nr:hypothetical protein QYE76_051684 [Lolium multiflorum]
MLVRLLEDEQAFDDDIRKHLSVIASLQNMIVAEAEKRKRPRREGSRPGRKKSKPRQRMEGQTMLHNDYFADDATHANNFRRQYMMSKGLFMNILHGIREFDPYFKLKHDIEACRKDFERAFGVLQAQFAIVRYPALRWPHDQMWEVVQTCVIMHNMIIEDDRKNQVRRHVGPNECWDPLAEVDHVVPPDFGDFLTIHAKTRDNNVHEQLQNDLVEHMWRAKGLSANAAVS